MFSKISKALTIRITLIVMVMMTSGAACLFASSNVDRKPIVFDVASVRINKSGEERNGTTLTNDDTSFKLVLQNVSLGLCLQRAFQVKPSQIEGPPWLSSVHIDLTAIGPKAPGDSDDKAWIMLQNLLKDRFGLAFTETMEERPGYALMVGKSGFKFSPVDPHGQSGTSGRNTGMQFTREPLDQLATFLERIVGRPVTNETKLVGVYTFPLSFSRESQPTGPYALDPLPGDVQQPMPDIYTAVQEQLGLSLVPQKLSIKVIHIENMNPEPSAN